MPGTFPTIKAILVVCMLAFVVQAHVGEYDIDDEPNPILPE